MDGPRGVVAAIQRVRPELAGRQPVRVPRHVDALGAVRDPGRRGGLPWKEFIRERITGPMALDELYIGCPLDRQHRVADALLA